MLGVGAMFKVSGVGIKVGVGGKLDQLHNPVCINIIDNCSQLEICVCVCFGGEGGGSCKIDSSSVI